MKVIFCKRLKIKVHRVYFTLLLDSMKASHCMRGSIAMGLHMDTVPRDLKEQVLLSQQKFFGRTSATYFYALKNSFQRYIIVDFDYRICRSNCILPEGAMRSF